MINMMGSQKVPGIPLQTENDRYDSERIVVVGSSACLLTGATSLDRFKLILH
jgi:hypothetical protein